jgi:hypothetical protein
MVLGYFGFGHIIYVSLLFTNAIAILNEERFLAKSESRLCCRCPADHPSPFSFPSSFSSLSSSPLPPTPLLNTVGWSTRSAQNVNAGFGAVQNPNPYDTTAFGGSAVEGVSIKTKLINLISATRTLMRSKSWDLMPADI